MENVDINDPAANVFNTGENILTYKNDAESVAADEIVMEHG